MAKDDPNRSDRAAFRKDLDLIIRQSHEQNTIIILKVHALQVEVQELRSAIAKSNTLFLTLLNDPETRNHAAAVAKDLGVGQGGTVKPTPH